MKKSEPILWFKDVTLHHLNQVGGKNASLGELTRNLSPLGIKVPNGFAITADAYNDFLAHNNLNAVITQKLSLLSDEDLNNLAKIGNDIRALIIQSVFPDELTAAIIQAYSLLTSEKNVSVAVRSSATAEDLPHASFAGQQESFLNVSGEENVLLAVKKVFASLFNDRAIAYRIHQKFDHNQVAISVGVQHMVRSDLATSGVMFSIDTETGFDKVVLINAAYGLGESVVQGAVNPDEFYVYKPNLMQNKPALLRRRLGSKASKLIYNETVIQGKSTSEIPVSEQQQRQFCLTNEETEHLAKQALLIEAHYGLPMDIEWAKDGITQEIYIVQARPETINSQQTHALIERYRLDQPGKVLVDGFSVGQRISHGAARVLKDTSEIFQVKEGDILVTDMTDPDWEPIMKKAAAIVTNRGGRTCHAAIIARELGIPAVVGCKDATTKILDGKVVTVSCAEGEMGFVYDGKIPFSIQKIDVKEMPGIPVDLMLNVGNPERAFSLQKLPCHGVGLARIEFIISNTIGIHPKAALNYAKLPEALKASIAIKTDSYESPVQFYVNKLQEGISTIAAAFYPKPVIVRLSDFKSNEYANLLGGDIYEPQEENPMLGFRGAARYVSAEFQDCFALECEAVRFVREKMGLTNVKIMIPFVRTVKEGEAVIALLDKFGLKRGEQGLEVIMMCEIPSNALLADQFLEHFDGFSIGSNDLTQLTLGIDRDSGLVADQFNERNEAVKVLLQQAISVCRKKDKYIGICGQGPSDHPDLAEWLVNEKIHSLSLNADSLLETWLSLAHEKDNADKESLNVDKTAVLSDDGPLNLLIDGVKSG